MGGSGALAAPRCCSKAMGPSRTKRLSVAACQRLPAQRRPGVDAYALRACEQQEFVLGDEINRAPAKTQSALLEAMQETQVTIEGDTRPDSSGP